MHVVAMGNADLIVNVSEQNRGLSSNVRYIIYLGTAAGAAVAPARSEHTIAFDDHRMYPLRLGRYDVPHKDWCRRVGNIDHLKRPVSKAVVILDEVSAAILLEDHHFVN